MCVLPNWECSEELFEMLPPSHFHYLIIKARHPKISRSMIPRAWKTWNGLPPEGFPVRFNMGFFKKRVTKALKGRQRVGSSYDVANVNERR